MLATRNDPEFIRRLNQLCEFRATVANILTLLPMFQEGKIREHWSQINSDPPKKGPSQHKVGPFIKSRKDRLHSSYCAVQLDKLAKYGVNHVDALIAVYKDYRHTFEDDIPNQINWLITLKDHFERKRIVIVHCSVCNCFYVHNPEELVNPRHCPIHNRLIREEKEVKKNSQTLPPPSSESIIIVTTEHTHQSAPSNHLELG